MTLSLTAPQLRTLRRARDHQYGATPSGPSRATVARLERLELVEFVRAGEQAGTWRPTKAGLEVLDLADGAQES